MEGGTEFDLKCLEKEYMTSRLSTSECSPSEGSKLTSGDLPDDLEDKVFKFTVSDLFV